MYLSLRAHGLLVQLLDLANVTVAMGTNKLVPSYDSNFSDIMLLAKEQVSLYWNWKLLNH